MKFVCPVCQTTGDIPEDRTDQPAAQTTCLKCGANLSVEYDTGRVQKQGAGQYPQEGQTAKRPRPKYAASSVMSMGKQDKSRKDYLALGVFAVVICALLGAGVYFSLQVNRTDWNRQLQKFSKLVDDVTHYGKSIVGEFQKEQKSQNRQTRQAKRHVRKGYEHYKEHRLKRALEELSLAIKKQPENHEAYFWRARTFIRLEQYDNAIADLNAVVNLNPRYAPAYDNLGWLFMRRNAYDRSLSNLNKSIELKPDNGWAHYMRSRVFFNKGDLQQAFENAKTACDLDYNDGCRDAKRYKSKLTESG